MPTYLSPGVYVEEVARGSKPIEGVGTAVAAFVGFTARAPYDDPGDPDGIKPRLVTNWSQFESLYGTFAEGAMLPHAVYGYFNNGGGPCYICRIPHTRGGDTPRKALASGTKSDLETLEVRALQEGTPIEVVIEPGPADAGGQPSTFTMRVQSEGKTVESFSDLTFGRGARNVESVVNQDSQYVRVKSAKAAGTAVADRIPAAGTYPLEGAKPAPIAVSDTDFEGSETERNGIRGLVIADEVTMVVAPDLVTAATRNGEVDVDLFKAVQTAMIGHCEAAGDRMAVLDAPPGMNPQQVKEWRESEAMYDSKFASLYYPWIQIANPLRSANGQKTLTVPPSGHMAGIWARNDDTRGVWKAPANEVIRGALDVETKVTKGEQDLLNPIGVNCIRPFGVRGIRVWGGRTLSSDPEWRYVNVRRLFNYIEESILRGTQWVVFEPNDMDLWARVKRTVYAFLLGLWRQGALFGATPEQAFYVKCDEETNPPESVDEGKLVVEIGVAPVKPAEFVIFRISQWQGGSAAAE
ncbi:MAG: phage tail sheath subtilisin-like domain-containing protein [Actinomycetota bacterium]|nr:phage tail sheath subtilisin-like domain-containing protein [Actinomycetota bacterium]